MAKKLLKLTASDITYLLNDCPHCFRAKVVEGQEPPKSKFPSVLSKLDSSSKKLYAGVEASLIFPGVTGLFSEKGKKAVSLAYKLSEDFDVFFSTVIDTMILHLDNTVKEPGKVVSVIDYKTSSKDDFWIYERQLWLGAHAIAYPSKGEPLKTRGIGLIYASPSKDDPGSLAARPVSITEVGGVRPDPVNLYGFTEKVCYRAMDADQWGQWEAFLKETILPIFEAKQGYDPYCPGCVFRRYKGVE